MADSEGREAGTGTKEGRWGGRREEGEETESQREGDGKERLQSMYECKGRSGRLTISSIPKTNGSVGVRRDEHRRRSSHLIHVEADLV